MSSKIWLCDDSGTAREAFCFSETVFVAGWGLVPTAPYEFTLVQEGRPDKPELIARYTTDRHGALPMTALLPYVGIFHGDGTLTRTSRRLKHRSVGAH